MSEELAPPHRPRTPVLDDGHGYSPIPLDGVLERQRYAPGLTVVLVPAIAFVLMQVVLPVLFLLGLVATGRIEPSGIAAALTMLTEESGPGLLFNSLAIAFGIGIAAVFFARMHSSRWTAFIRLRRVDAAPVLLAVVGLAVLMPLVSWLGEVNSLLPLPEFLQQMEALQLEFLSRALAEQSVWVLLLAAAVTPAFCEELMFRGYLQRQAERSLGAWGGILVAGVVFGIFHLRLGQVLPLSVLGVYLAYLTWCTGSLWPAIAVHFANNGFAVAASAYVNARPELGPNVLEQIDVPWYYIVLGLAAFVPILLWLHRRYAPGAAAEPALAPSNTPPGDRHSLS